MMDSKEIIEALENCYTGDGDCLTCPYTDDYDRCVGLIKNALALIKELTEENERLRENNIFLNDTIGKNAQQALEVTLAEIEKAKADALRDMQSRLAQYIGTYTDKSFVYVSAMFKLIERIAKEMVEDE